MSPHGEREQGSQRTGKARRQRSAAEAVPTEVEKSMDDAASTQQAPAGVQSVEPQDSHLTGASRKLQQELLQSNVADDGKGQPQANPVQETPTGLHATGSIPAVDKTRTVEKK